MSLPQNAQLTDQRTLFPKTCYSFGAANFKDLERQIRAQRFEIKDDLLYACITYGDGLSGKPIAGFTRHKGLGYALLAFFVQRALKIDRLPFCGDRIFSNHLQYEWEKPYREILGYLTPSRVDSICQEVKALYDHTQRHLSQKGLSTVVLRRCVYDSKGPFGTEVGYAELLFKLARACSLVGQQNLQFEMDVLNSYGDDHAYQHFPVAIIHEVPVKDIFYCSNLIHSREPTPLDEPGMAVEDGEWVVINRSPTGVIELPVDAIQLNHTAWKDEFPRQSLDPAKAKKFIQAYEPVVLRSNRSLGLSRDFIGGSLRMTWKARVAAAFDILRHGRLR